MPNTFEFMNNPIVPGQEQQPMQMNPNVIPQPVNTTPQPVVPSTPSNGLGFNFPVVPDNSNSTVMAIVDNNPMLPSAPKKRAGRPRKKSTDTEPTSEIVRSETGEVEDTSAIYSYGITTSMLHDTVKQIDCLACEVKDELDQVRLSKTYRNKSMAITNLSSALGRLLEAKVSAISQINNSISKANELDYKVKKDRMAAQANAAADDKYVMDMYSSFINQPRDNVGVSGINVLGPTMMDTSVMGLNNNIIRSDIIRADSPANTIADAGYFSYAANMTPEQRLMELQTTNPNICTAVIYDASTGAKTFAVIDKSTGQNIPNVPVKDNRFLEDTTINLKTMVATNNNLHETYPVVCINESVVNEY